ncbi:hypothetical protein QZH41_012048 [Actinostola sp. cb2023]|nr:hypothetical protein QZH41_012048 [Actinostola sp. cb2023]
MDLRKVPDEEKVRLCRKYTIMSWQLALDLRTILCFFFVVGLAFLPFVWFINVVWFFREAFCRDSFPGQAKMKGDLIKSGIGLAIWIAGLVTWIVIFLNNRASWGEFGDQISFLIPLGQP